MADVDPPPWHVRLWRALFVLTCVLTLVPVGTLIMTATGHNDGSVLTAATACALSALGAILAGFMYRSTAKSAAAARDNRATENARDVVHMLLLELCDAVVASNSAPDPQQARRAAVDRTYWLLDSTRTGRDTEAALTRRPT